MAPMETLRLSDPDHWIEQVFAAQAVAKGGVIRRHRTWVWREIGAERFIEEVRQRGFHLVEAGEQWIVICNCAPLRRIC